MNKQLTNFVMTAMVTCLLNITAAYADSNGHGKGKGHIKDKQHHSRDKHDKGHNSAIKEEAINISISFDQARIIAVKHGLTGYQSLPPGIAKNLARGKPLPPGIAKKVVPATMLTELPHYPGYEWYAVGDDLVLVAATTLIVETILHGIFN